MKKLRLSGKDKFIKGFWIVLLIGLWEVIPMMGLISPLVLPRFSKVAFALLTGLIEGDLLIQLLQSIGLILAGLMAGSLIGLAFSYFSHFHAMVDGLMDVLSSIFHPLPGIALLPVIVLWFGIGFDAVFMVILHAVIWSFYLNMRLGYGSIDPSLIEAARNNGASNLQLYRHVLLPGAKEAMITGMKIGWSRGWRSLISAEMIFGAISSIGGIGWFMFERRAFGDTVGTYSGILVVAIVGILVEQLIFRSVKEED